MTKIQSRPVTQGSPTFYADEGTIAHTLAALCLTEGKDAAAYVGRILEEQDYPHSDLSPSGAHRWARCAGSAVLAARKPFTPRRYHMEVTEEMADDVQVYVDNIRQFADGGELLVEQRVDISHVLGYETQEDGTEIPRGGTADAIVLRDDEWQVHDLKFGRGVGVDAAVGPYEKFSEIDPDDHFTTIFDRDAYYVANEQLLLYALGAYKLLELLVDKIPERCRIVIHQPRITRAPKEFDLPTSELLAFANRIEDAVKAVEDAKAFDGPAEHFNELLNPGEKQCRFCPVTECRALDEYMSETVFGDPTILTNPHETAEPVDPRTLSAKRLGTLLDRADLLEAYSKRIREHAYEELMAGRPPIHKSGRPYKLVAGRKGNRRYVSAADVEALLKGARVTQDEMYERKLKSPKQLENAIKKSRPRIWARVEQYIDQPDGKPHVAPPDDPRPELPIVLDEFEVEAEDLA